MIRMKQKQEEQEYCVETDKKGNLKCVKRLKKKKKQNYNAPEPQGPPLACAVKG